MEGFTRVAVGQRVFRVNSASIPVAQPRQEPRLRRPASSDSSSNSAPGDATDNSAAADQTQTAVPCPPALFADLAGKRSSTIAGIENRCHVRIDIPKRNSGKESLDVYGASQDVARATADLKRLISQSIPRLPYTHFLSLHLPRPSEDAALHSRLAEFKQGALPLLRAVRGRQSEPAAENLFAGPSVMHATIAMLRLHTRQDVDRAKELLQTAESTIATCVLDEQPLVADVKGLGVFPPGKPESANVVWAHIDKGRDGDRITKLCDWLIERFHANGIIPKNEATSPTLHATLVNVSYGARSGGPRVSLDALAAMSKYESFDFGSTPLKYVKLCRRERVDGPEGKEYAVETQIALPQAK
ncbi:activating signal cointegrator 1 complex subunit [Sorochytrium milnesiophthora]